MTNENLKHESVLYTYEMTKIEIAQIYQWVI